MDRSSTAAGTGPPTRVWFGPIVGLLALVVLAAGCNQERIDRLETRADSLRDSLRVLAHRADTLERVSRERARRITESTELIGEVLDRLSEIARRENVVREAIRQTRYEGDEVENLPTPDELRSEMHGYLSAIETHLRQSRRTIDELQERTADQETEMATLVETVERLRGMIDRREATLTDLRRQIDTLSTQLARARDRNRELTDRNEQLTLRTEAMGRAYVVVADEDSLDRAGIVNDRFLLSTRLRSLDPSKFTPVEVGTTRIELPRDRKGAEVFSVHRRETDLYEIQGDQLHIRDPDRFWAISRYLIVEVDR